MGLFSREKYILVDIERKETVWEGKEFLPKEDVEKQIENENLEDTLYREEMWRAGKKVRNEWVMRKPKKKATAEELAILKQEEAEEFIQNDAADIKARVEAHRAFANKVKQIYGIEAGGGVNNIKIPSGKYGTLGILEAVQIATAESAYEGIRENPSEVAASVKSIMNMVPTILAGVSQLIATKITESNKRKETPPARKEEPAKKVETPQLEATRKDPEVVREKIGKGITKFTFGDKELSSGTDPDKVGKSATDPYKPPASGTEHVIYKHQNVTDTSVDSTSTLPNVMDEYEQYKIDMLGNPEEEVEEDTETE